MAAIIRRDMEWRHKQPSGPPGAGRPGRRPATPLRPDGWADLAITSPPYANNYDYADATRLEMTFFREVNGWAGLQDTVRKYLVRS